MSKVKTESPTASEPDCFIVNVRRVSNPRPASSSNSVSVPSTPSRRGRPFQDYINAQAASSSRATAPSPSSIATPTGSFYGTPRKRERSRSPDGTPSSVSKRNRIFGSRATTASTGSPANFFYDAQSNQGDGADESGNADRLIFSPHAASPPVASGSTSRTQMLSQPIPFPLSGSSLAQRPRSSSSSSSSSSARSPSPASVRQARQAGSPTGPVVKREDDVPSSSFSSSAPSSSQPLSLQPFSSQPSSSQPSSSQPSSSQPSSSQPSSSQPSSSQPSSSQPSSSQPSSSQPSSSQPSSSQPSSSQSSLGRRIVKNPEWTFEIDRQGVFRSVFYHWRASLPARLPSNGPVCKGCDNPSMLEVTGKRNTKGNAGRPYYKCHGCKEFITWADLVNCDDGNMTCKCKPKERSRTVICGPNSKSPGKRTWKCASAKCDFEIWESDWDYEDRIGGDGDLGYEEPDDHDYDEWQ